MPVKGIKETIMILQRAILWMVAIQTLLGHLTVFQQ